MLEFNKLRCRYKKPNSLIIDRYNNDKDSPKSSNSNYGYRQGGTFDGITKKLDYIASLGAREAQIWMI